MNFILYEELELDSPLPADKLEIQLQEKVETNYSWLSDYLYSGIYKIKPFRGKLGPGYFKILRVPRYHSAFLPVIEGRYYPKENGTKVTIKYRLNYFVFSFWIFVMASFTLVMIISLSHDVVFWPMNLISLPIMLLFVSLLFAIPFNIEVREAKKQLDNILKG